MRVQLVYRLFDLFLRFPVAHLAAVRHHRVEDDVRVRRPCDHAEVVDGNVFIDAAHERGDPFMRGVHRLVVRHDGVHVDDGLAAKAVVQFLFHVVDLVMQSENVAVRGDLGMQRDHHAAGAVVVHDKVMDAADALVRHDDVVDLLHELLRRRLAKQGRERVLRRLKARPQDEQRHDKAAPAIDLPVQKMPRERCKQHRCRRRTVGKAVRRRGLHGGGVELLTHAVIVAVHVALGADGDKQDRHRQRAALHRLGVKDRAHRVAQQLKAHEKDDERDDEARNVLDTAVAEGMLGVRLLPGEAKAQQRHDGRARVGEVVEGVRRDGDGAGKRAGEELEREEQQVDGDAHRAAKHAVGAPHLRRSDVLIVFYQMLCKQSDHCFFPHSLLILSFMRQHSRSRSSSVAAGMRSRAPQRRHTRSTQVLRISMV